MAASYSPNYTVSPLPKVKNTLTIEEVDKDFGNYSVVGVPSPPENFVIADVRRTAIPPLAPDSAMQPQLSAIELTLGAPAQCPEWPKLSLVGQGTYMRGRAVCSLQVVSGRLWTSGCLLALCLPFLYPHSYLLA